ncbi:MAG: accessory gene regulator B family protein [Clostridia bacterium]|nr:accessory gene regulator B family protein [Clostridia bacterium]
MIEKICNSLTNRIRLKMPEIDDERAEIINYGLQLVIGEIPKNLIMLLIAWALGVLELSIFTLLVMLPYKIVSGGVHLKTHIGCIITTSLFYSGTAILSKNSIIEPTYLKYLIVTLIWLFSIIMISLYAPADTEEVPILRKNERKIKKILSYIFMTATLLAGIIVKDSTLSNILIFGTLIQTIFISKVTYTLTKCKYGYLEAYKNSTNA